MPGQWNLTVEESLIHGDHSEGMKLHWFEHAAFESLGAIQEWVTQGGHALSKTVWNAPDPQVPDSHSIEALIVMGGPMSVNDEVEYPWLCEEKAVSKPTIDAGIPILGICMGAQLIASAFGASVTQNPEQEMGWYPVIRSETHEHALLAKFSERFTPLHWHGQTFGIPHGALPWGVRKRVRI